MRPREYASMQELHFQDPDDDDHDSIQDAKSTTVKNDVSKYCETLPIFTQLCWLSLGHDIDQDRVGLRVTNRAGCFVVDMNQGEGISFYMLYVTLSRGGRSVSIIEHNEEIIVVRVFTNILSLSDIEPHPNLRVSKTFELVWQSYVNAYMSTYTCAECFHGRCGRPEHLTGGRRFNGRIITRSG